MITLVHLTEFNFINAAIGFFYTVTRKTWIKNVVKSFLSVLLRLLAIVSLDVLRGVLIKLLIKWNQCKTSSQLYYKRQEIEYLISAVNFLQSVFRTHYGAWMPSHYNLFFFKYFGNSSTKAKDNSILVIRLSTNVKTEFESH